MTTDIVLRLLNRRSELLCAVI